jgi:uncharacterized protein YllA (UPF0747 family)
VYVGGGAEVKYWSQLKGLFDNYQLPMPYIHLRSSKVILPNKIHDNYGDKGVVQLFGSADQLRAVYAKELVEEHAYLSDLYTKTLHTLLDYTKSVESAFKGFSLNAKVDKIRPKLQELEELVSEQMNRKSEQNPELNKVLKIQAKYFNQHQVQERTEHLLAHPQILVWSMLNIQLYFGLKKNQKVEVVFT